MVHLALVFKDFASWCYNSCVGLNIAGYSTGAYLHEHGVDVSVFPVRNNIDLVVAIDHYNETHSEPLTHVVISAPWLTRFEAQSLVQNFKDIQFVILSHSNVGFLQADPHGIELLRAYQNLAETYANLKVGGNNEKFVRWMEEAYGQEVILLPNLYYIKNPTEPKVYDGGLLKIGAFGAIRPEKNFLSAVAAAVAIHSQLQIPVELHMSSGGEGEQGTIVPAIDEMIAGIPDFTLVRHNWVYWNEFVKLVSEMDLLLQPSYTESFNMVTADGIYVGVPSVVSSAITWAPNSWKADTDNALDIARVGIELLNNPNDAGLKALKEHNESSFRFWSEFLYGQQSGFWHRIRRIFS